MTNYHLPVMLDEVLEALNPAPGAVAIDGTLGNGGHALEIAKRLGPTGVLIGIDRDPAMLEMGRKRLEEELNSNAPTMHFFAMPFARAGQALAQAGCSRGADAALLDLGVNSLQLEEPARGFSFSKEGPLDARFNQEEGGPAMADLVNTASVSDLARWFRQYGDERLALPIAKRIDQRRKRKPFETTTELADLVQEVYPPTRKQRIHASTRVFQALRIVVNDELGQVERGVRACMEGLSENGKLAVLTFHSGEDRIVKRLFREASDPRPDPSNPFSATSMEGVGFVQEPRRAIKCSKAEAAVNPRSRSAKLRVIRRKEAA